MLYESIERKQKACTNNQLRAAKESTRLISPQFAETAGAIAKAMAALPPEDQAAIVAHIAALAKMPAKRRAAILALTED